MQYLQICYFPLVLILAFLSKLGITRANYVRNSYYFEADTEYNLCTSQICEDAGNEILMSIDRSVDPCDDFGKHACNGRIANYPVSETVEAKNQYEILNLKLEAQLKEILQDNEMSDSETVHKVIHYYRSCQDLASIDARGLTPLVSIVLLNGGWPITVPINKWHFTSRTLTLQKIHENYVKVVGSSALFNINVQPNPLKSSGNFMLVLSPAKAPIKRRGAFLPPWKLQSHRDRFFAYGAYIQTVAKEFARLRGLNVSFNNIERDLVNITKFEISLTELYPSESRDYFGEEMTIAELQNSWNTAISGHPEYAIDWMATIISAFSETGILINKSEKIAVIPGYIEKLAQVLKKSDLRTVVNYVHWHAIDSLVPYTNKKMRKIISRSFVSRYGYNGTDEQRSIFCIGHHQMRHGLTYAYVRKYFNENISLTATQMVSQIETEMKRQIDQCTWMSDSEKFRFQQEIVNMVKNIGYLSWYDKREKIDEYYNTLTIGPDYFENVVNYNRFKTIQSLKRLREPYSGHTANFSQASLHGTIRTHHSFFLNSFSISPILFQLPFFHAERPLVMNYGNIGVLIGRAISYALGINGRRYNEIGDKKQWLSNSTLATYNEKAKCYVEQYNNYTIDGQRFLEDNIVDNTGIVIALKAYLSYMKKNNLEDIKIPVLQTYTDAKLFFYSLGNFLCTLERPYALAKFRNFKYSYYPVRINAVVSNMPEFSEAFNCPSGRPMNPVKKCHLWA